RGPSPHARARVVDGMGPRLASGSHARVGGGRHRAGPRAGRDGPVARLGLHVCTGLLALRARRPAAPRRRLRGCRPRRRPAGGPRTRRLMTDPQLTEFMQATMPFAALIGAEPISAAKDEVRARIAWDETRCTT